MQFPGVGVSNMPMNQTVPENLQASMIRAVADVFKIQFSLDATAGTPFPHGQLELSACQVGGFGMLVLPTSCLGYVICFPESTCLGIMSLAFGRRVEDVDTSVTTGVLEVVSILGARSKSIMTGKGIEVERNIPVCCIHGKEMGMTLPRVEQSVVIPYKLEKVGDFFVHLF